MSLGVTIGKFYPLHRGHDLLIAEAKRQVGRLVVLSCSTVHDDVPGTIRAEWIREMHPDVTVLELTDDLPESPAPWAERTIEALGRAPDVVFTSEAYGDEYAALMGARHIAVDLARTTFPVSGSELRADIGAHWEMLTPPVRAFFARRVCVIGAESSGTTTLAAELGAHYETAWVPEYGRWYWEGRRYTPDASTWSTLEFVRIAKRQGEMEDDLARLANRLVICDTDALATHVWHRRFTGEYSPAVEAVADARGYDLYVVTRPDFPFIQDGTREGEHIRARMHDWMIEVLESKRRRYVTVTGTPQERVASAVDAVNPILKWIPLN